MGGEQFWLFSYASIIHLCALRICGVVSVKNIGLVYFFIAMADLFVAFSINFRLSVTLCRPVMTQCRSCLTVCMSVSFRSGA